MSKKRFELLSEAQWELIETLLPAPNRRKDKRGRPCASNQLVYDGRRPHYSALGAISYSLQETSPSALRSVNKWHLSNRSLRAIAATNVSS